MGRKNHNNPPGGHPTPGSTNRDNKTQKAATKRKSSSETPKSGLTPEPKIHSSGNQDLQGQKQPSAATSSTDPTLGSIATNVDDGNATQTTALADKPFSAAGPVSPAKSTSSVTSNLRRTTIHDPLDEEDIELLDLDKDEETEIGEASMKLGEDDTEGSDEPPQKKTWASVAKPKVQAFEVLYVHQGTQERAPIPKETFTKLYGRINCTILEKVLEGHLVPDEILWRSWKDGRGLIAVKDKETSDFICETVGKIQVGGHNFRAWHRGEFSRGRLATGYLDDNTFKSYSKENLLIILMRQNKLPGNNMGAILTTKDSGRLFQVFCDPEMWTALVAKREGLGAVINLKMGATPVKFKLSKEKPREPEGNTPTSVPSNESEEQDSARAAQTLDATHKKADVVCNTDKLLAKAEVLLASQTPDGDSKDSDTKEVDDSSEEDDNEKHE